MTTGRKHAACLLLVLPVLIQGSHHCRQAFRQYKQFALFKADMGSHGIGKGLQHGWRGQLRMLQQGMQMGVICQRAVNCSLLAGL